MLLDIARVRHNLQNFDLHTLFVEELGWENHRQELVIAIDGQDFRLQALAHKRGLVAFRCNPDAAGHVPPYPVRRKIETQVTKSVNQHLIIYADAANTQQVWQWVKRGPGKPTASREQSFSRDQTGEALIQKLNAIAFSLEDEADLGGIVQVAERVRTGFDVERVTKRFYEQFKAEHAAFSKFLSGIPDEGLQRWYVSVMLNRLMFIYFIQKKGFLDGDLNYLRTRLAASQATAADRYYADFLCPLFFEGFARRPEERSVATSRLLGQAPYLNGGIFERHQIEMAHGQTIQVPDAAFERLFDFFDAYNWHLDERPLRADNEINPDVLGYIFEKYINQKQMGAYYTKEDITGYISLIIVAFLLDEVQQRMASGQADKRMIRATMWGLLVADPDRYIYPAMRHGAGLPLPSEIAAGLADVAKRTEWNRPAPAEYALPTEIWREVVARRQRYEEVKAKLAAGEVQQVNDLITYNLDLRQFAQDVIASCDEPELLRAFWRAIETITVLDPTVGSGAFLFAALNVLEPLYEGCLERMQAFIDDYDRSPSLVATGEGAGGEGRRSSQKFSDFRKVLARVAQHPNPCPEQGRRSRYFILKSIVINNLYGVDIMEEAVEICKLRLFLKLVAQVERVEDVEPLPDIDFNIRAGNTLVGYATRAEVERALTTATDGRMKLMFEEESTALQRFEERAADVERLFGLFRQQQTELGGQVTAEDKTELRRRLDALDDELNRALAQEYGVDTAKPKVYKDWLASHKPFHWFVEFYGILRQGGFSVVIGNPPYVVYAPDKVGYGVEPAGYSTLRTRNLYPLVFERSLSLVRQNGLVGLIVQLTALSSERLPPLQELLMARGSLYALAFPRRPESIFDGVEMPVAILLSMSDKRQTFVTSRVQRFYTEERDVALQRMTLTPHLIRADGHRIAKISSVVEQEIYRKISRCDEALGFLIRNDPKWSVYYQEACRYWAKACRGVPFFRRNGETMPPLHGRVIGFSSEQAAAFAACLLNSSLFYWFYSAFSDCEHINDALVRGFRFPSTWKEDKWVGLSQDLTQSLINNAERKTILTQQGHTIEYDEIKALRSKPIIDEIDRVLARHYGFTDEELDFIINYDIKYRMGDELATDENG